MKKTRLFVIITGLMFAFSIHSAQADLKPIVLTPEAQQDAQKVVDLANQMDKENKTDVEKEMEIMNQVMPLYEKKYKKDEGIMTGIGQYFLQNHLYKAALEMATAAYQRKTDFLPAIILQGDAYAALKNMGDAAGKFEEATTVDPKEKEPYFRMVDVYKTIAPELALEKLNIIKKEFPNDPAINKAMGSIYYHQNKIDDAIASYDTYLTGQGNDVEALTEYAILMYIKKDFQKSLDIVNKILPQETKSLPANRMKFYNLMELKKTEEAKAEADTFFKMFIDTLYNSTDYKYYGDLATQLKDTALCVQVFEKAVKIDPKKGELYKSLSDAYENDKQTDKAVKAYLTYCELTNPTAIGSNNLQAGKKYLFAAAALGSNEMALKKHYIAAGDSLFTIVENKAPDSYLGPFWRARIQSVADLNNPIASAKDLFAKAYKLLEGKDDSYDSYRETCLEYETFYAFKNDDYGSALEFSKKVLALNPSNSLAKQIFNVLQKVKK